MGNPWVSTMTGAPPGAVSGEVSSPRAAPPRPATVTGAERSLGLGSAAGTVRLADFALPRRRARPMKHLGDRQKTLIF